MCNNVLCIRRPVLRGRGVHVRRVAAKSAAAPSRRRRSFLPLARVESFRIDRLYFSKKCLDATKTTATGLVSLGSR